jgi:hypothetical protein
MIRVSTWATVAPGTRLRSPLRGGLMTGARRGIVWDLHERRGSLGLPGPRGAPARPSVPRPPAAMTPTRHRLMHRRARRGGAFTACGGSGGSPAPRSRSGFCPGRCQQRSPYRPSPERRTPRRGLKVSFLGGSATTSARCVRSLAQRVHRARCGPLDGHRRASCRRGRFLAGRRVVTATCRPTGAAVRPRPASRSPTRPVSQAVPEQPGRRSCGPLQLCAGAHPSTVHIRRRHGRRAPDTCSWRLPGTARRAR